MPTAPQRIAAANNAEINIERLEARGLQLQDLEEPETDDEVVTSNEVDKLEEELIFMNDEATPKWIYGNFKMDLLAVKDDKNIDALRYICTLDSLHLRIRNKFDPEFKRPKMLPSHNIVRSIRSRLQKGAIVFGGDDMCQQCQRLAKKRKRTPEVFEMRCWAVPGSLDRCSTCAKGSTECSFQMDLHKPTFSISTPEDVAAVKEMQGNVYELMKALPESEIKKQLLKNMKKLIKRTETIGSMAPPNMRVGIINEQRQRSE